jgi:probable F420-dependent oxidoreductase
VPAEHTQRARAVLGPDALLAPEVSVVLESDPQTARELARTFTTGYLGLPNYVRNLRSLGFDDDDVEVPGSDRLVDAIVCWGNVDTVASKVQEHFDAGADHVCIQVISGARDQFPIDEYRELAPALTSLSGRPPSG